MQFYSVIRKRKISCEFSYDWMFLAHNPHQSLDINLRKTMLEIKLFYVKYNGIV